MKLKYKYKGIKTTIKVEMTDDRNSHWIIKWKNKYHKWDDSSYWVNKDLNKGLISTKEAIREEIDRKFEMEFTYYTYIYKDIPIEVEIVKTSGQIHFSILDNAHIDYFSMFDRRVNTITKEMKDEFEKMIRERIDG